MTSVFEEREEEAIRAIAARYQSRGYNVVVRPGPELLPEPLKGTRPDLLAGNSTENVVIEVKSKASLPRPTEPKRIAQSVATLPGWRFELVVVNPELQSSVPARGETLSLEQIHERLDEAKTLVSSSHFIAAFVIAWSAAEAVLRQIASKNGLDTAGYSPAALYKELYSAGIITRRAYETLAEAVEARNSLVHGFKVSEVPLKAKLQSLIGTVDRLLRELHSARAAIPSESGRRGRRTSAE
jgi:uncharacterized protein YutE (UPF0331/DUF86 family)